MNLKQLQFVVNVAKEGSFSKAAEISFATQPTLSNAIAQLEEELGDRLFQRTTRSVELTAFGEFMLPKIEEVLRSRDEMLGAARSYHNPEHKVLRIGFSPLVDMQRLNHVLEPFRQIHPEVTIFFKECFIDELDNRLDRQQIDLQIVPRVSEPDEANHLLFYRDPLWYLPAHSAETPDRHLSYTLSDLPSTPVIMTGGGCGLNGALDELFSARQCQLTAYPGQAISYQVIEDWAGLGIGAGILPRAKISAANAMALPLFCERDQPACFDYYWIWNSDAGHAGHLQAFIDYLQHQAPVLLAGLDAAVAI